MTEEVDDQHLIYCKLDLHRLQASLLILEAYLETGHQLKLHEGHWCLISPDDQLLEKQYSLTELVEAIRLL